MKKTTAHTGVPFAQFLNCIQTPHEGDVLFFFFVFLFDKGGARTGLMSHVRDNWRALVTKVMKFGFHKMRAFLDQPRAINASRGLLHGFSYSTSFLLL